jgi:putative thioredoxin
MAAASPWVIETTAATFNADVIERSRELPIVIDFWAPWCGPCRQLAPVLEKLAQENAGKFVLVKVNIDQEPEIAGAFGVQSIPFVVALVDGQPVDHFVGVVPEPQLRDWVARLLPSPADELVKQGRALEARDPQGAERAYREASHLDPENDQLKIHLARVLTAQSRIDEARRIIQKLEERGFLEPEAERLKSQLDLLAGAEEAGSVQEARRAVAANPDDPELHLKLADALAVAGKHEEALQICLKLVATRQEPAMTKAKETMVKIFALLGGSELVSEYRRKLATLLY